MRTLRRWWRRWVLRDPFADPKFWHAWHNPPCPDVEEVEIYAVYRCVTFDAINETE